MTDHPGINGVLPLPTGAPMKMRKPSPSEKAVLEQVGWKAGDPVPKELAGAIDQLRAAIAEAKRDSDDPSRMPPPVPLTTPVLKIPESIDIENLPPEKRAEYDTLLRGLLDQAKLDARAEEERNSRLVPEADSSINQAILASRGESVPGVEVIVDTEKEPEESAEEPVSGPGKKCPYCGWPAHVKDTTEYDETDKTMFVAAVIGGVPFRKTYYLYGRKLSLTFRTLTPDELDAAHAQVFQDGKDGVVETTVDGVERMARYMAMLQLERMAVDGQPRPIPTRGKSLRDDWEVFRSLLVPSATMLRHMVGTAGRFNKLAEKLEVNATNPDFWSAIDLSS